jgi:plasmid maintenance system antidote protein VapI
MKQMGMNYSDVAHSIGVVPSNVRKYILFRNHSVSQQKVLAIASNLGITVSLKIELDE